MGVLSGSASFMRFSVEGDLPDQFWDFVADRVAAHSFQDIDDIHCIKRIFFIQQRMQFPEVFDPAFISVVVIRKTVNHLIKLLFFQFEEFEMTACLFFTQLSDHIMDL